MTVQVRDIMTGEVACCTPEHNLQEVARMMVDYDCGEIPVVISDSNRKVIGVITDRDITCRTVAIGRNPLDLTARDCMSPSPITVSENTVLKDCSRVMEENKVRRLPVVSDDNQLVGIVSQADIARVASEETTAEVVRQISRPSRPGTQQQSIH